MDKYHLVKKSSNSKVGPIPVTTSPEKTCPDSCPLKNEGCYASSGFHTRLHWNKVSKGERGDSWQEFIEKIKALPAGQVWRHNQAGDLPGENESIDRPKMLDLIEAAKHTHGWTYTHKNPDINDNDLLIDYANSEGFTVNLSADSLEEADRFVSKKIGPVTVVLPEDAPDSFQTAAGNKVKVCFEQTGKFENCKACKLCYQTKRKFIIGFRVHGTGKNKINFND